MDLTSELPLWVYEQIPLGIDRIVGYTRERDESGRLKPVRIPNGRWYVRHTETRFSPDLLERLVVEVNTKSIPGLSLAGARWLGAASVVGVGPAPNLITLDLFNTPVEQSDIERLLESHQKLRSLCLAGTSVSDAALREIATCGELEYLDLGWTRVGDEGLRHVAGLRQLKTLILRGTRVTDAGTRLLGELSSLEALQLEETGVGDTAVANLVPLSATLRRLYLGYTRVTEASHATLRRFAALQTLMVRGTPLSRTNWGDFLRVHEDGPFAIQAGLIT